ncbi:MAG: magnesium transporter CorA family protein [Gaiellaceae bacterium]
MSDVLYGFDAEQRERVAALRAQGRFFWLDVSLSETSRDELFAALSVPDGARRVLLDSDDASASRKFHADGQAIVCALRCYVESEPSADETAYRLRPLELSVVITGEYLLTLHQERVSLPATLAPDLPEERTKGYVVYSVLDAIVASTFDALEEVELRLDAVAETSSGGWRATRAMLAESAARLATMRRWVTAEHAVFERIGVEIVELRGFETSDEPYFDRLDQQLDVLLASIDAAANAMGMLIDLQLNERAYVVSVVATIFVPLTFITGFFGMNFGWMVDHIDSPIAFWLLAFLLPLATALVSWRLGVRRFLVGDDH